MVIGFGKKTKIDALNRESLWLLVRHEARNLPRPRLSRGPLRDLLCLELSFVVSFIYPFFTVNKQGS